MSTLSLIGPGLKRVDTRYLHLWKAVADLLVGTDRVDLRNCSNTTSSHHDGRAWLRTRPLPRYPQLSSDG